jgi:hypothetical protein
MRWLWPLTIPPPGRCRLRSSSCRPRLREDRRERPDAQSRDSAKAAQLSVSRWVSPLPAKTGVNALVGARPNLRRSTQPTLPDVASVSGAFGTTRRTVFVFALALSRSGACNPASPQSVPASVLLNFFMTARSSVELRCSPWRRPASRSAASLVPSRALGGHSCNVITFRCQQPAEAGRIGVLDAKHGGRRPPMPAATPPRSAQVILRTSRPDGRTGATTVAPDHP